MSSKLADELPPSKGHPSFTEQELEDLEITSKELNFTNMELINL